MKRAVKGRDYRLLDLGTAHVLARNDDVFELQARRVLLALAQMDLEEGPPLVWLAKVDEEDLVEATLAHQHRRQGEEVVRGGDDEHGGALLLEPGEEAAMQALREAAVLAALP